MHYIVKGKKIKEFNKVRRHMDGLPPPFLKKSGSGTEYCLVYNYVLW